LKKVLIAGAVIISLAGLVSCSDILSSEKPQYYIDDKTVEDTTVEDTTTSEIANNLKTYKSVDGWSISYPSSWNKVESSYIQEEATGKTLVFNSDNTTKEELESWLDTEIKRKLGATEANNTIRDALDVKKDGELWYYTYTINCKMDGSTRLLATTVIFDGNRKYEFWVDLSLVTEKEYSEIIKSFSLAA